MRILKPLKLGWMAEACGGRVLQGNQDTEALTVCIDSRKITPGALFVALPRRGAPETSVMVTEFSAPGPPGVPVYFTGHTE